MKRKCLNLDKKIEILNYAATHPELGCRNLAEHFFLLERQLLLTF